MAYKKKNTKKVKKDNDLNTLVKSTIIITFLTALLNLVNTIYTVFIKK